MSPETPSQSPVTRPEPPRDSGERTGASAPVLALTVVWAREEDALCGQVFLLPSPGKSVVFGRSDAGDAAAPRALLTRQRPGRSEPGGGFNNPHISRQQLRLTPLSAKRLAVENLGQCPLVVRGEPTPNVELGVGDLLQLGSQALFMVTERPRFLPTPLGGVPASFPFGRPDPFGMVGESPVAWKLREEIAFAAPRDAHVLVCGPSGSGKELVARALHAASPRGGRALVARNAATLPESLIDAELFGNTRNYPNAGMPERPGLVGEADGSTLFLDEIGELPETAQSHLLRVLDGGEYHRLGESRTRSVKVRLVAATNRGPASLKHDLAARLPLRIDTPGLDERREDIPLVAEALLDRMLAQGQGPATGARARPRLSLELTRHLVVRPYDAHVRELEAVLWESLAFSRGRDELTLPAARMPAPAAATAVDPQDLDPAAVQSCLDQHQGEIEAAARALGLSSRHALARLVSRHALRAGRNWRPAER